MKSLLLFTGIFFLLLQPAAAQSTSIGNKIAWERDPFQGRESKERYILVDQVKDSLSFRTRDNVWLGSTRYSNEYVPDSISKQTSSTVKRVLRYEGKDYVAAITTTSENGITMQIRLSVDDKEVLTIESKKGFHCTNHGAVVHKCPCSPSLAKPPCPKDCVWVAD